MGVAGFQVSRVSDSLIENCTFSNTIKGSSPDGQGFDFESDNQNVTVRKCRFLNNDAAGLLCFGGTWPGANAGNVVMIAILKVTIEWMIIVFLI